MHPPHVRESAEQMMAAGVPFVDIWRILGVPRSTVRKWFSGKQAGNADKEYDKRCPFCSRPARDVDDPVAYAYLLGAYPGDGHLLMTRRVPLLTIACDRRCPGLISEMTDAVTACGATTVGHRRQPGCLKVACNWMHWPFTLPQHGPGKKHVLTGWQQRIVDDVPHRFLRGLFHSDGCRTINRIRRAGRTYEYPRYLFVNESTDIIGLCQQSLDRLGISWKMCRPNMLSVARRDSVARLDQYVGPKW